MRSIVVFLEREIDGKLFLVCPFQSQTNRSSDSGGDANPSLQPLFLCPSARYVIEMTLLQWDYGSTTYVTDEDDFPFKDNSLFFNVKDFDPQLQSLFDAEKPFGSCDLPLVSKDCEEGHSFNCFICSTTDNSRYYCCPNCSGKYHKECLEAPLSIKHPSYPFLSLQLYFSTRDTNHFSCFFCQNTIYSSFYYCPTFNIRMHPFCALKPIPVFIDHPKRHPHPLTFFPQQAYLPCHVCGLVKEFIPTYICARCVYVVHQECIYFPYVIRISRHQHHISFTSSLPSKNMSCGVCRQKVDKSWGAYSCNKCPDYFVHSRCATRRDLWDGEELEGVPEEPEIVVEPFVTIADGIILHFSHDHHLKLEINNGDYDDGKFCQACVLPIYEGNYYSCMDQCDFILHEACASSPLKIHHPLHRRPLMLKVVTDEYDSWEGGFHCSACRRYSSGFVYEDSSSYRKGFQLDVRCASVSEPFEYEGHEHPLFLALTPEEEETTICQICKDTGATDVCRRKLNCIKCDFVVCFECATLPYKARYKHDKHFLTFRKAKTASDESGWCEVCEKKIKYSGTGGYYTCDDYCCTTLHVNCLLGTDPYMKPGQTMTIGWKKVLVRRNNTMYRPWCYNCNDRCIYRVLLKVTNSSHDQGIIICSHYCGNGKRYLY